MNGASVVVDTNVPVAANERSEQASPECVAACREAILGIMRDQQRLALDDGGLIVREYRGNLSPSGQPGLGDAFLVWVHTNWANPERCDLVVLTEIPGNERMFLEFPEHPALARFDPSDKKFVAVANAHAAKPPILEAVDFKWWGWKEVLAEAGVSVEFLCPNEAKATHDRKSGAPAKQARRKRG